MNKNTFTGTKWHRATTARSSTRLIHAPRTPHALGSTPGYEHDLTRRPSVYSHLATPFNAPVKAWGFFMPPVNTLLIRLPFLRTIVLDSEIDGVRLPGPGASLGEPLMNVRERLRSKCRCEQFSRSHQERIPCPGSWPRARHARHCDCPPRLSTDGDGILSID